MYLRKSLTCGFPRFGWSNDSYFNRMGWGHLWLSEVLQRVELECIAVLFGVKEVDILMEHQGVCGIKRPLQRLD